MKDPRVAVAQIPDCIQRIRRYTAGGREVFFHDSLVQDAVIRNFEVIGEAAKRIPDDYRLAHSHLPWREMAGFRDVLIHQCEGVSLPEVWRVVEADLPRIERSWRTSSRPATFSSVNYLRVTSSPKCLIRATASPRVA